MVDGIPDAPTHIPPATYHLLSTADRVAIVAPYGLLVACLAYSMQAAHFDKRLRAPDFGKVIATDTMIESGELSAPGVRLR